MSSKQWFILKTDHHIGPLETQQVIELYRQRRLKDSDLLWAQGHADWRVIKEIPDFDSLFAPPPEKIIEIAQELPPPLPPIPSEVAEVEIPELPDLPDLPDLPPVVDSLLEVKSEIKFELEANELEVQEQGVEDETEQEAEKETEEENEVEIEDDFWEDQLSDDPEHAVAQIPRDKTKWIIAVSVGVIVMLTTAYFFRPQSQSPVFHELRVQDAQRMEQFLRETHQQLDESQMPFAFSLSRDGRGLMVVSPYPQEARLYLELESIRGQVLSFEDLAMKAEATLLNHQAWFRELQLRSGMSLAPGKYKYKITAVPVGPIAHLRKFLQQNGLAKGAIQRFSSQGEVYLLREDQVEFEKKLAEHRERLNDSKMRPLQERIQHYQTLDQMAEQILNLYRQILPTVQKADDMRAFELQYAQSVGQLLQSLILETHQRAQELMVTEAEEARTYERLRDFGREVGELVSDMVTTTEQTRDLDVTKKNRLVRQFENRVKNLQREAKRRVEAIEGELETYR